MSDPSFELKQFFTLIFISSACLEFADATGNAGSTRQMSVNRDLKSSRCADNVTKQMAKLFRAGNGAQFWPCKLIQKVFRFGALEVRLVKGRSE